MREPSTRSELDPVDGQTLSDVGHAVDDHHGAPVHRVVGRAIGGEPITTTQRRIDDEWPLGVDADAAGIDAAVRKPDPMPELCWHGTIAVELHVRPSASPA